MSPSYVLVPKETSDDVLKNVHISRIGFSFVQPFVEGMVLRDLQYDICLIRTDGTVLTDDEMREIGRSYGSAFLPDTGDTQFTGNWGGMPAMKLIDLDEYCGLQINGTNYYYAAE